MGTDAGGGRDPRSESGGGASRVGRYELLFELATGGMATVHVARANDAPGGQLVAVKICHPHLRRDEDFVRMFLDEVRVASLIRHPNVVATLDAGDDVAHGLFMTMEFVDGYSLWQLFRAAGVKGVGVPAAVAVRIAADALRGLAAAHALCDTHGQALNVVHRDVSPHNVLVGIDGVSRIMDFGIARIEQRLSFTREGMVKGKLAYMAPEQLAMTPVDAGREVTHRADLYAAGVVLWEALTGQRLFQGDSDLETVKNSLAHEVRPPSSLVPTLPRTLDAVVFRALARDPAERFASGDEFAEALSRAGVTPASDAEVAAFVSATLHGLVVQRREALARATGTAPPREVSGVIDLRRRKSPPGVNPDDGPERDEDDEGATTLPGRAVSRRATDESHLPPQQRRRSTALWMFMGLTAAALVAGTTLALNEALHKERGESYGPTVRDTDAASHIEQLGVSRAAFAAGGGEQPQGTGAPALDAAPPSTREGATPANEPPPPIANPRERGRLRVPHRAPSDSQRTRQRPYRPRFL